MNQSFNRTKQSMSCMHIRKYKVEIIPKIFEFKIQRCIGNYTFRFSKKNLSPSLGGTNYFIVFTEDFSHHSTVYPIKEKSEVLEKFIEYRYTPDNFI